MELLGPSVPFISSPSPSSALSLLNLSLPSPSPSSTLSLLNLSLPSTSPSLSPSPSMASTALFCFLLSLLSLLGIVGNLYTIGLLLHRRRGGRRRPLGGPCMACLGRSCLSSASSSPSLSPSSSPNTSSSSSSSSSSSLHIQVLSLAMADLLYLSTAPFVVYDSLTSDWAFGEVGCRLLLSLDLLTMHASIFTLTAMSVDRYRAVAHPLAASVSPSSGLLRVALAWGGAVALSLPMMITLHLEQIGARMLCEPAWDEQSFRVYLSVLFCTSILAPGLAIGALYAALGRLYWRSQSQAAWSSSGSYTPRAPRPKVLLLILGIVLAFWACFLPFWVWQLLPLYQPDFLPSVPTSTQITVNRILTGLTFGNSSVNPFFYTLLTGKRRRNRQTVSSSAPLCQKTSSIR
ncbi:urotensin-2 receptor-like [Sardina pilchardus]|uniref:urotensin-2 receptor-like n=1 Tax=Sardina pilchardus TaxID=27697 RepID=UPI002E135AB8